MKFPCKMVGWLVLWCLTILTTILQLYRSTSIIGARNRRTWSKPPTCRKSLYRIMLYTLPWSRLELATSVVIGTDCIGSCIYTIIPNLSFQIYAASQITHLSLRWNGKTLYLTWSITLWYKYSITFYVLMRVMWFIGFQVLEYQHFKCCIHKW